MVEPRLPKRRSERCQVISESLHNGRSEAPDFGSPDRDFVRHGYDGTDAHPCQGSDDQA